MDWIRWTETMFLSNDLGRWALAVAVGVAVFLALRFVRGIARRRLLAMADQTRNVVDDILSEVVAGVRMPLMLLIAVWAGAQALELAPSIEQILDKIVTLVVILQAALWGNRALHVTVQHYRGVEGLDAGRRTTLSALTFLGRLALFTLLILLALDNLGIDVTALLAGIGIASVGIGLALQNIMSDLFASLSIILDKPFEIGDFIIVGDIVGTVENVGLRTTRVRSLAGEQLVVSNNDLLQSRIRNLKRMEERRVVFTLGVTYGTPRERLAEIPGVIRAIVEACEPVRFDRAHFHGFGDFSLNFEVVYWMLDPDYNLYMDVRQQINLDLVREFESRGIEFAFPTQTLFLQKQDDASAPNGSAASVR